MVPVNYYLIVAAVLFVLGVLGVLMRRNALIIFMSIELMLNAVNLTFVVLSRHLHSIDGQIFVFFIMTVAAAEVAVPGGGSVGGLHEVDAAEREADSLGVRRGNVDRSHPRGEGEAPPVHASLQGVAVPELQRARLPILVERGSPKLEIILAAMPPSQAGKRRRCRSMTSPTFRKGGSI